MRIPVEIRPLLLLPMMVLGAGVAMMCASGDESNAQSSALDMVIGNLKTEEGFRALPYSDAEGVLTIGYGTNLDEGITTTEAEFLLRSRLTVTEIRLRHAWRSYADMPMDVQAELLDIGYQLGVSGLLRFSLMLQALERGDFRKAADEALDSSWAEETPARARQAARVFRRRQ